MKNKFVMTIGREYGSGGRVIGRELAKKLDINFYDDELIELTAKESGFATESVARFESTRTSSFLYNAFMASQTTPISEEIFKAQARVIKNLAENESCIIVSHCADYILKDYNNILNTFIYAPMESRIKRTKELYCDIADNYESYVKKMDKKRADYYNHFTPNRWGERSNYHIMLDSSIGIDTSVNMLEAMIGALFGGDK